MNPIISVIVPVFRVEEYLTQCVDSILHQSYRDYEIILVDDGSDDNCPQICDELCSSHANIRVLHQRNKGLSAARNRGIEIARGKYIVFCDSDDKMKPNMLQTLVNTIEKTDVDVVMCGYETFPNGIEVSPKVTKSKVLKPSEFIYSSNHLHSDNDLCFSWRFLIKRELIDKKKIRFNEKLLFGEDFPFNFSLIMEAKNIYVIPDALYLYRIDNANSIMRTKYKENLEEKISLQYQEKVRLSKKYGLWDNLAWRNDLCDYYINMFAWMVFRNVMNAPVSNKYVEMKRVIRLPFLVENYKYGFKHGLFYQHGRKNGLFLLACCVKMDWLVYRYVIKHQ